MAGIRATLKTAAVVATGTNPKTILQLVAPSNHRLVVKGFSITFAGTSGTASPIPVDLMRQTTAGTMSAATPTKVNSADDETLQATGLYNATVEPTSGDILKTFHVHPQGGYEVFFPFGEEIIVPGGTRIAIRTSAAADVNCHACIHYEE